MEDLGALVDCGGGGHGLADSCVEATSVPVAKLGGALIFLKG